MEYELRCDFLIEQKLGLFVNKKATTKVGCRKSKPGVSVVERASPGDRLSKEQARGVDVERAKTGG